MGFNSAFKGLKRDAGIGDIYFEFSFLALIIAN